MDFDANRVRQNAKQATTEDLLDRVTVFRAGMEPDALPILEAELASRGVRPRDIDAHAEERSWETIPLSDGTVAKCSLCYRPAVVRNRRWHWMWRLLPLFPHYAYYCTEHHSSPRKRPRPTAEDAPAPAANDAPGAMPRSSEESFHIRLGD